MVTTPHFQNSLLLLGDQCKGGLEGKPELVPKSSGKGAVQQASGPGWGRAPANQVSSHISRRASNTHPPKLFNFPAHRPRRPALQLPRRPTGSDLTTVAWIRGALPAAPPVGVVWSSALVSGFPPPLPPSPPPEFGLIGVVCRGGAGPTAWRWEQGAAAGLWVLMGEGFWGCPTGLLYGLEIPGLVDFHRGGHMLEAARSAPRARY